MRNADFKGLEINWDGKPNTAEQSLLYRSVLITFHASLLTSPYGAH